MKVLCIRLFQDRGDLTATMTPDPDESRVRYRRTQSVTRAEEISGKELRQRRSQPDKP